MDHRVVIYTNDMEPITVVELTSAARELLMQQGRVRLAVMPPFPSFDYDPHEAPFDWRKYEVELFVETLLRHGKVHKMVFTHNEESALLLKAAFLPGQYGELGEVRAKAMADGFIKALGMLG